MVKWRGVGFGEKKMLAGCGVVVGRREQRRFVA
jgi:hypothetical protein